MTIVCSNCGKHNNVLEDYDVGTIFDVDAEKGVSACVCGALIPFVPPS